MGRTTRASLKGKQAADEDSTFDYNEVKHRMVTTPIVPGGRSGGGGADKRKAAPAGGGGGSGRAGDKENRAAGNGGGASEQVPPSKRAKGGAGGGGAAAQQQPQQQAAGSVRYPRLDYAKEVPPTDREFTRADVPGEEKLVSLAARVMEADARKVEEILFGTKYQHLSQQMEKFASVVEQRLVQALKEDARQEEKERAELARLEALRAQEEEECKELDKAANKLKAQISEWEAEMQKLEEGPGGKKALERLRAAEAALEARESPYLSPAMKATVAMLESGARVKREALAATTELLEALEAKAPQVEEAEAAAAERQRELAQAFQGAQFAGLPDVQAPQRAAKGLASASAGAGGGAGAKKK